MALFVTVDYALAFTSCKVQQLTLLILLLALLQVLFSRSYIVLLHTLRLPPLCRLSPGTARHPGGDAEGRRRGAVPSARQSLSILYRLWSYIKRGRSEDQLTARGGGGAHFGTGCSLTPPAQCRPLRPCSQVRGSLITHDNSDNRPKALAYLPTYHVLVRRV